MKKTALLIAVLVFSFFASFAQPSWQWARSGGSPGPLSGGVMGQDIADVTTDKWGNVYVVASFYPNNVHIADQSFYMPGGPDAQQTCVACFGCDGRLKWYKMVIGSGTEPVAVKTDTLGGVYVTGFWLVNGATGDGGPDTGYIQNNTVNDTTISPSSNPFAYRTMYLLKLDTAGTYKWLRMPEADTTSAFGANSYAMDLSVDDNGNSYMLCALRPGTYGGTYVVPTTIAVGPDSIKSGIFILKYNKDGNCTGGIPIPITEKGDGDAQFHMTRDSKRDRYYIDGYSGQTFGDTTYIAGDTLAGTCVACFNGSGGLMWMADVMGVSIVEDRVVLDQYGYIYTVLGCQAGLSFNGTPVTNPNTFVVKLDTNGHNVWISGCTNDDAVDGAGIAVSGDTVAVTGMYSTDFLTWGADTVGLSSTPYQTFLCRLNATTGAGIWIDTVKTDGGYCFPAAGGGYVFGSNGSIAADPFGNFYAAGSFRSQIYMAGDTLINIGTPSNWWLAKFGTTNCTETHTGTDTTLTSVAGPVMPQQVSVYPNPACYELNIANGQPGAAYTITNMVGQAVSAGTITNAMTVVNVTNLAEGTYIITIVDNNGNRSAMKFCRM